MKKILLMIIPRFVIGGAENMMYELVRNIDKTLYSIQIFCVNGREDNILTKKIEKVANVNYMNCSGAITMGDIYRVCREISKVDPDIIHAHMGGTLFATIWSMLHKKPMIVTVHTSPKQAFSSKIKILLKMRFRFPKVCLVTVSKTNKNLALDYYKSLKWCECVNNGIDIERFYRKEHEYFTYINVARQDDNKNQRAIIESFEKIYQTRKDVRLMLVGDGPNHQDLKQLCYTKGLTNAVVFTGNISDVENYYAISDVYVQASHREAMPLSVLEAMATGLPIISTNVGGMCDVVIKNGVLISDNNSQELFEAMQSFLYKSKQELFEMGNTSKKLVEEYSSREMANKYMDIYSDLL